VPTFLARRDYTGLIAHWVQVADTNGDGIPDLIACSPGAQVLFGDGDGTFGPAGNYSDLGMSYIGSCVAIDVNGDGITDLVVAGTPPGPIEWGVGVSLGNGDGTFQPVVFYPAGSDSETSFLTSGDFDGDGTLDVVTAGASGLWLFTGNANGTFNPGS
jgi:hypothetical protein